MTRLFRHRVTLGGETGLPGVCTFYSLDINTFAASLHTLWLAMSANMPNPMSITFSASGDVIEDTTGTIVDQWAAAAPAAIASSGGNVHAAGVGGVFRWNTSSIVGGHRVRGRNFAVPISAVRYDTTGTLDNDMVAAITIACASFVFEQQASFVIWSRPFAGAPAVPPTPTRPLGKPARPARVGSSHLVTNGQLVDKVAVLRSRRN